MIRSIFLIAALVLVGNSYAAQLVADFRATSYTGSGTWYDSVNGVGAVGSGVANGTSVDTSNGAFLFSSDQVPGFSGSTSFSLAVGFIANTQGSGSWVFQTGGPFGGDIGGGGSGDSGIGFSSGRVTAGIGSGSTDFNLISSFSNSTSTLVGAVLVEDGTAGTISLYVNGTLAAQLTGMTVNPVGFSPTLNRVIPFQYAIGGIGSTRGGNGRFLGLAAGTFQGSIIQAQIYTGALSSSEALALSANIVNTVPEPSTYALFGLGALALVVAYRRKVA
jgi:hypothetical protein